MHFGSMMSRAWKTTAKTVVGIFTLFVIVLILPRPVDALQTALVRASDGNVYQIRFPNGNLSGGYNTGDFIDGFSIYDKTGTVELCPGNDQSVTRELYTAARVLAKTPRNTSLFDTSPLADTMTQTAEGFGIDQEGNVDVVGIVGDIVEEMAVDELQGQIQPAVDPSLNLGIATINLNTFKIKINVSGPDIIVKPTEFLSRLVSDEIELRWMLYAFSRASTYANTTIHLQTLANHRAAALWDAINAGKVVDIAGHAFTIHEDTIEISNEIGIFDPFRLRLAAGVYRAYAEYVTELGTNLAEHEGPVATLANRISVDIITEFLFTLSDAQSAIGEKEALDELDAQIPGDINLRLHANMNSIYDSATSDLTQHGFCTPDLRFTSIPSTVAEGDTFTYTVALNSVPSIVAAITISSNNPDVMVSPASLTFTPNNWYIPKRVVVDVSVDADSIDESVSLKHIVVGYGGGMVRNIQFDITDQISNRAPRPANTIPDQTLTVGDSSAPLDLSTYFHDPDGDTLIYTVVSSDPNVATAQRVGSQLTVWPLNIGNTTLTVRATDTDGLFIIQTFTVTVEPAPVQQRPEQVGTISTQYMTLDGGVRTVDVAPYFSSENALTYEVSASPFGFVTATISGSQVTITPLQAGSASVFVTARDSQNPDLSAIQTIPVSISHAIIVRPPSDPIFTPPTTNPDVEGLREGVSVITQLTAGFRLNVRERPGTDEEIIEQLGSGVIGTITDGPVRADDFRWWEIEWEIRGLDLEGWSAEADRGQILFRRPPDLEIQDLDVDKDEVEPGDRFTVDVRVLNNGPGESVPTEVSIYYSLQRHSSLAEFNADSNKYEVGTINIPSLRAGRRTERSLRVDAPRVPGRYYFGAYMPSNIHPTDYQADLASDARENDLASQERVEVTTAPDLIVASISSDKSILDPSETFRLDITVRNQGVGEPENNTTLRYYRSSNAAVSSNDTEVGTDSVYRGDLDTNGSEDESISLTAPNEPGVYYYGACVDAVEHESNTRNNCSGAVAITVRDPAPAQTPDLVPSVPTVSTNALAPGAAFTLETIVENRGTGTSGNTMLRWYQSADPNISSNDTEVGTARVSSLLSAQTATHQLNLNAPVVADTYYYGVGVEGVADESDMTNNYSIGVAVTVENRAPNAVGTFPAQTLSENDAPVAVDVAGYFNDPNNTTLIYTAVSENPAVVLAQMSGSQVTITPVGAGNATVIVTASDGALTARQTISVSVIADLPEETWMPDANLRVAVRNALSLSPNDALTQQTILALTSLRYVGTDLSDNQKITDLTGLEYALNLDHLNLYGHLISDIRPLERSTRLRSLWLAGNKITNIRPLTSLPLEELGLGGNPIADFAPLAELTSLTRLDFWGNRLGDSDFHFITGLTQLTHLNLRNNQISDITLVTKLVNLEVLQLKGNPISDTSPLRELLRQNPNLEIDIEISEEPPTKPDPTDPPDLSSEVLIPDANLRAAVRNALSLTPNEVLTQQAMLGLTSLRYLGPDLSDNQKIGDLTGLEYALNLDHLNLYAHFISDIRPLEKLVKLRSLWLAGNKIANIRPLTSLPLEELGLGGNPITDFTPLVELTSLTRLDFWGNGLGNSNLSIITRLTQLTQLDLRNNQINDITSLTKLVNLKKLQLKGNPISDTSPLRDLLRQNPDLEIDIEISDEPPSEPDTEIEAEGPDLIIESVRVNNTTVTAGDQFRLDAVIRNQGKAASGAATIRFYRSSDETISTVDTQVNRASLPAVAVNATRNKWVLLTAPNAAGVYYYGVCVDGVADESDTENNCSTAVKVTVGTQAIEPIPIEPPVDATSLAKQVFEKHSRILRRQDVKEVLPNVLTALKEPDIQPLLIPATINLVIADPDLLKKTVPTISDEFIVLLKQDAEIKTLLSDPQVQTLLQTPAAIDELAKLLGISAAPLPTPASGGTVVFRDTNLANKVREALNLPAGADIPKAKLATLTRLDASVYATATAAEWEKISIKNLTGLEHATQLKTLLLTNHRVSNIASLAGLTKLEKLVLQGKPINNIGPLRGLTNLQVLYLYLGANGDRIKDLAPLAGLTNLTWLSLSANRGINNNDLTSLAPSLAKMKNLEVLNLPYNQISNVTPLASVTSLKRLDLRNNQISDVTPLAGLTNLEKLWIFGNPITDEAQFQVLLRQNPNLQIYTEDLTTAQLNAPSIPVPPAETVLLPNYPNPFNPETWIPYQLAAAADVTLTIYDVKGIAVRRLVLGHKPAGFYQSRARAAHWDGRNALGEKVASGLYFYTFTAGDFTATGRMLIRK